MIPIAELSQAQQVRLWTGAERALQGVGDPLHEWRETGVTAVHWRRRLTVQEWHDQPWGMDYRGTEEGERLLAPCRPWLGGGYRE